MDGDLRTRLGRWFATVVVDDALPDTVDAFLSQLVDMLDELEPTHVDPGRSAIRDERDEEGYGGVEVRVAHDTHQAAGDILIELDDDEAIVECLDAVRNDMTEAQALERRPWPMMVVDFVARLIGGEYEVENHYRGRRLKKVVIVDVRYPNDRRVMSIVVPLDVAPMACNEASRIGALRLRTTASGEVTSRGIQI